MEKMPISQEIESQSKWQWRQGLFNHLQFGMTDEEVHERIKDQTFDKDWWKQPLAINRSSDGSIHIASVPSGKGIDIIWGMKFELTLYPDGRYFISTLASWVKEGQIQQKREGRPRLDLQDGCQLHPSCFECPEDDCIRKGG